MSEEEVKNVVESGESNSTWTSRLISTASAAQSFGKLQLQKASETASNLSGKVKESETMRRLSTTVKSAAVKVGDAAKVAYDKTGDAAKVVYTKTGVAAKIVYEKAGKGYDVAKRNTTEAAKIISEKAGKGYHVAKRNTTQAWKVGSSQFSKLREEAKQRYPQYFKNSEEESASIQAFREALASGYEGVEVKASQSFQLPFRVTDEDIGDKILIWEFFLWNLDVNFKVVMRTMSVGGAVERDVFNGGKVKTSEEPIKGQFTPKEAGTIALIWDNTSSWIRSKHIAYRVRLVSKDVLRKEEEMKKRRAEEVASSKQQESSTVEVKKRESIHLEQAGSPVQLSKSLEESATPIQLDLPAPGTVQLSGGEKKKVTLPPKLDNSDDDDGKSKMKLSDDGSVAF